MKRFTLAGSVCVGVLVSACGGGGSHSPTPAPAPSLVTAPVPVPPPAPSSIEVLRADLEAFRVRSGLPGLSVVVVDGDRIDTAIAGVRRTDKPGPVQPSDQFHIGSMGKSFTASLIARLVEADKLNYDATLAELFPTWRAGMHPAWHKVTVAQLLRHRSGMKRDLDDADIAALLPNASGNVNADRLFVGRYLLGQAPALTPDTTFSYSNLGYVLLGLIAEAAAQDTYENLLGRQVLAPLGITAQLGLAFDPTQTELAGHIPAGAKWQTAPDYPADRLWLDIAAPAGGLKMNMANYGIYLREQLRGLKGQSSFLRQDSYILAHTPVDGAGFGWFPQHHPTLGKVSAHGGTIGTSYSLTIALPERNRAVAIACNCSTSDAAVAQIDTYLLTLAAKAAAPQ